MIGVGLGIALLAFMLGWPVILIAQYWWEKRR